MLSQNQRVIVISSVSGGGKTSLIGLLVERHPQLHTAITATSRPPRVGEVDGVDYHFLSAERFREKIQAGEFIEYAVVHGNYYGVPAGPLIDKLEHGISTILNIDVQGMRTVRERLGERVVSIFLMPPDETVWEQRLRARGTDSEQVIQKRLAEGRAEMRCCDEYDHCVVNDDLQRAVEEVGDILRREGVL